MSYHMEANESKFLTVKYDYEANEMHELSIKQNERLRLIDGSKNWWKVENSNGQVGYVPKNFVSDEDLLQQTSQDSVDLQKCNVLHDYKPRRSDEMQLIKGEELFVIDKSADGWWKGQATNDVLRRGWFPSNYVEIPKQGDTNFHNIASNKTSYLDERENNHRTREIVKCLYSFTAKSSEELSFTKGEILEIIDNPEYDPEWIVARRSDGNHEQGLIPKNYVQQISETSEQPTSLRHPFVMEPWYYGSMKRDKCEYELNCRGIDGDFIIRDSESNPGDFSISLKNTAKNRHFWIHYDSDSGEYRIGNRSFSNMEVLVQFYMSNPIYSDDQTELYLIRPLSRVL